MLSHPLKRPDRGSHIAGRSVHNQRIEPLWRDLFCGCLHVYYNLLYAMERCVHQTSFIYLLFTVCMCQELTKQCNCLPKGITGLQSLRRGERVLFNCGSLVLSQLQIGGIDDFWSRVCVKKGRVGREG